MNADDPKAKWHQIDQTALSHIEQCYGSTGIHQVGTTALPAQIQKMEGLVSYFVSAYSAPIPMGSNTLLAGEMAVVRTDGDLAKAYNYVLASSNDGRVYFNGPHYNFPQHHFASTSSVETKGAGVI
jgi:hypothetical protein